MGTIFSICHGIGAFETERNRLSNGFLPDKIPLKHFQVRSITLPLNVECKSFFSNQRNTMDKKTREVKNLILKCLKENQIKWNPVRVCNTLLKISQKFLIIGPLATCIGVWHIASFRGQLSREADRFYDTASSFYKETEKMNRKLDIPLIAVTTYSAVNILALVVRWALIFRNPKKNKSSEILHEKD